MNFDKTLFVIPARGNVWYLNALFAYKLSEIVSNIH
jgi:hypothetical protein